MTREDLWTEVEDDVLRDSYPSLGSRQTAQLLPVRSWKAVRHRASQLKIRYEYPKEIKTLPDLEDTDLAYLAGIIDGEGSVTIRNDRGRLTPTIDIGNTNGELMERLKEWTMGWIYRLPRQNERWKDCYHIRIDGISKVYPLVKRVLPYLVVKKPHAEVITQYCESRMSRQFQNSPQTEEEFQLYQEVRDLNRRGKTSPPIGR